MSLISTECYALSHQMHDWGEIAVPSPASTPPGMLSRSPVGLLQDLLRFDTTNPPGNEKECLVHIQGILADAGCESLLLGRSSNRPNLIARLGGRGQAPPLLLHGHLDVVPAQGQPWQHPPFDAEIADGYVWGRGALDMKGGVVMMLTAFLRLKTEGIAPPGDVILALVSDEEAGGKFGTKYLVENHRELFKEIRYAIGEFGGFSFPIAGRRFYPIMVAEKQICVLRATIRGSGGHGALRGSGSAAARLARVLQRLERRQLPLHLTPVAVQMFKAVSSSLAFPSRFLFGQLLNPIIAGWLLKAMGEQGKLFGQLLRNTVNPTIIRGGDQINVVPSEINLGLDGRLLPGYGSEDLINELHGVVGDDVVLEVVHHEPGPGKLDMGLFDTLAAVLRQADPEGHPVPMLLPAATDGRFLARLGIQSYGFLPMTLPPDFKFSQTIHGPNERIPVQALDFGSEAMYQLLLRFDQGEKIGPSGQ